MSESSSSSVDAAAATPVSVGISPSPTVSRWTRFVARRSLVVQAVGCGVAATVGWMAVAALALRGGALSTPVAVMTWMAATGLLVSAVVGWCAARWARGLRQAGVTAAQLRRDDAHSQRTFVTDWGSVELLHLSRKLQRLVERMRARQRALIARNAELAQQLDHRTHELSTLQDLSIHLASVSDIPGLVTEALQALAQTMDFSAASVWGRDVEHAQGQVVLLGYRSDAMDAGEIKAQSLTGLRLSRSNLAHYEQIERERQSIIDNHVRQSLLTWLWELVTDSARTSALYRKTRAWAAVPMSTHGDMQGVLRVDHDQPDFFDEERLRLLQAVASQTALAIRHARLSERERDAAVVAERNRIARDLHDAVSQTLFAVNMMAGTLARAAAQGDLVCAQGAEPIVTQAQLIERLSKGALAEMRLLMFELRPDALADTPMAELLAQAVAAMQCRVDLVVEQHLTPGDGALSSDARVQLYRIAQEALSNVARHSGARHVTIEWDGDRPDALLRIADDGVGFDPDVSKPGHFGLQNMRERAQAAGARLTLASAPDMGTELRVQLLREDADS